MKAKQVLGVLLLACIQLSASSEVNPRSQSKIVIIEGPIQNHLDTLTLNIYPFLFERFDPWIIKQMKQPLKNGYTKWEVNTKVPVALFNNYFSRTMAYLAEPGDSIYISHIGNKIVFTGRGSEKFQLSKEVELFLDTIRGTPEGLSDGDKSL
ncbi:hypothetical protein [Paraflavitalea speifideaquila]|uniref:hypothetical protein n=1 Tax=Paraflavitalea speifideaquila TaxID=3076558 RepID=UPI0028E2E49A|nr:hypothetical protein [Paraflavitalea speifideiaquila]